MPTATSHRSPTLLARTAAALPVLAAIAFGASPARAQAADPVAAQALFDEAKRLREQGRLAEACPKFLSSYELDPKPGAALTLADCYEKNGQVASAWARYLEAASLAQRAGQADREKYAREHAATLEHALPKLTINLAPANRAAGLEVRRDGILVNNAVLGSAIPVDPGKHQIEVRATGKKTWSTNVDVPAGAGQVRVVEVPPLEDGAAGPPPPPPPGPTAPTGPAAGTGQPPVTPPAPEPVPFWGAQRIAGASAALVGVGLVVVGSVFGAKASSDWSTAKNDHCGGTTVCDATGVSLAGNAKSEATISSATFIPGAVALAAGVIVFFTAPKARPAPVTGLVVAPAPLPGGGGLFLKGDL